MHLLIKTLKLFFIYARPYKKHYILGLLCLFLVDALGILTPLLLKSFIDESVAILNQTRKSPEFSVFINIGIWFTLLALFQGILRYLWRIFLIRSSHRAGERLREAYFSKLQRLPPSFYDRNPIGDLMALATNDVEAVRFALGPGLLVFADAIFILLVIFPTMLILSPKLALFCYAPLAFLPFIIYRFEKLVHERFHSVQEQFSKLSGFAQETIEGIKVIKAFVREKTQLDRFSGLGVEFIRRNVKLSAAQSVLEQSFALATALGLVSLIFFAAPSVIDGTTSIGTFVAFTRYLENLAWPMMALGMAITHYQRGKTSLSRIHEVLSQCEETNIETPSRERRSIRNTSVPLFEARNLSFRYSPSSPLALKNINFRIESGTRTALIGRVGSGKSTLVKLLAGLYPIEPEMLYFQGVDITTIPLRRRRELISIAPQETFLFSESLKWNVGMGEDHNFSQIQESLEMAGLNNEWKNWGLDAKIGEKGLNLSGGQRARVTLARALLRKNPLLVLDDVLSSIDIRVEQEILKNLLRERSSQAILMITHRLSGLQYFDQVLVLERGELIQAGSPQALTEIPGLYNEVYKLQRMHQNALR